jgi:hypothetical protein
MPGSEQEKSSFCSFLNESIRKASKRHASPVRVGFFPHPVAGGGKTPGRKPGRQTHRSVPAELFPLHTLQPGQSRPGVGRLLEFAVCIAPEGKELFVLGDRFLPVASLLV